MTIIVCAIGFLFLRRRHWALAALVVGLSVIVGHTTPVLMGHTMFLPTRSFLEVFRLVYWPGMTFALAYLFFVEEWRGDWALAWSFLFVFLFGSSYMTMYPGVGQVTTAMLAAYILTASFIIAYIVLPKRLALLVFAAGSILCPLSRLLAYPYWWAVAPTAFLAILGLFLFRLFTWIMERRVISAAGLTEQGRLGVQ
jgi:hypothetical protein